jgi:hypothetical protein
VNLATKTLTIDEVEDAILQGQEVHARIMADVLAAYFEPLIDFQLAMMQQGGMNESILGGMVAPGAPVEGPDVSHGQPPQPYPAPAAEGIPPAQSPQAAGQYPIS